MSEDSNPAPDAAGLRRIDARLREIADLLGSSDTTDAEAIGLAREAAGLVSEALEETERAVAGLEQED